MLGTIDLSPVELSSTRCLNITFCRASQHCYLRQKNSLASSLNMLALTCIFFYLYRLRRTVLCKQRYPVFSAFLDASKIKSFDRTCYNLLFTKLIKRDVSVSIVRLLLSWHRQQTMQVKWGTLSWHRQQTMQVKWGTNFPSPLL